MTQKLIPVLFLFLLGLSLKAQSDSPIIGVPVFAVEAGVEIAEGSLLLLGEAVERGLSEREGLRVLDRRRLDAVFQAREEVRHEDYLASDRERIAALGANYLLVGRVLDRNLESSQWMSEEGSPAKSLSLAYRLKVSLIQVSSGQLVRSEQLNISANLRTQAGEPEMDAPVETLIAQLERKVANALAAKARRFAIQAFQGGMQVVDVLDQSGKKINEVLVASTLDHFRGQELNLYKNEYYALGADTLARPIFIGEARVRHSDGRLLECKILNGQRKMYEAVANKEMVFAVPGEQEAHWLSRLMFLGVIK